jgi:predicted lipoprotein with Yx(FWY)xxD motif
MRRLFAAVTVSAFVVALGAPAFAKEMTVKGELVDQGCYLKDHAKVGASHKACAGVCAKKGLPMAILTEDGKLYQITGDLAKDTKTLADHASHTVEVTGDVTESDGKMMIDTKALKMLGADKTM